MASCPSCGAETRQGDWTCRSCGSPLGAPASETGGSAEPAYDQAYYEAPTIYGTAAPSNQRPAAVKVARGSALPWLVGLVVVVAVALVAGWFFVLRPSPGAQFVGTWRTETVTAGGTTAQTLTIARTGAAYTIAGAVGGQQLGHHTATLTGGHLESVYTAPGAQALQYKELHAVLTVDGRSLTMVVRGTTASGASVPFGDTERFTRDD